MDGLLIVDKPAGPTSHEVVARVRRALGERRLGHTGTLDPAATGVLPLVIGRATRLARFFSESDKSYDAVFRLGVSTDTHDADGAPTGFSHQGEQPSYEAIDRALDAYRATFLQTPPAYSAKKIEGRRSYKIAREASRNRRGDAPAVPAVSTLPKPASVTGRTINLVAWDGDTVSLRITCSAGFYVRALARDLGEQLGVGAHVLTLRRTSSGDLALDRAIALGEIERDPESGRRAIIPLARMLPGLDAVTLTSEGVQRALHGRDLGPGDTEKGERSLFEESGQHPFFVRLVDQVGNLVAIASPVRVSGLLHPAVVLM
jgi:tRNA pseudouridine55 synthase